jgi:hypothetical protein
LNTNERHAKSPQAILFGSNIMAHESLMPVAIEDQTAQAAATHGQPCCTSPNSALIRG